MKLKQLLVHTQQVEGQPRVVHVGPDTKQEEEQEVFPDNTVQTTKYTLVTYLPKGLFEQYRRVANVYFTIIAALSLTPISPVQPWSAILPLVFVIGVSMVKEAIEDHQRYKADKKENAEPVLVLRGDDFERIPKKDIQVGDFVKIEDNHMIPADLLLLSASNPGGNCYILTANLDGETNLKIKRGVKETWGVNNVEAAKSFSATLTYEQPNNSLYTFTGSLSIAKGTDIPLVPSNVLLRGSQLKNTGSALGVVLYTGKETKIMKNATAPRFKRSQIEKRLDKIVLSMLVLLIILCFVTSILFGVWTGDFGARMWYLDTPPGEGDIFNPSKPALVGVLQWLTSFVLYGYFIPISLYVSVEVVKVFQSMIFINQDIELYCEETDTRAQARTSNLNEELGMVQTILSDKTGTLTQNKMEFFKFSIAGVRYGRGASEIEVNTGKENGEDSMGQAVRQEGKIQYFNFRDERLTGGGWRRQENADTLREALRVLAICHTGIPDGPKESLKYQCESPDENALIVAAKQFGFSCTERTPTHLIVEETQEDGTVAKVDYEILAILEFNSERKRMSVIFKDIDGRIIMYCKGADNVIFERLSKEGRQFAKATAEDLGYFAGAGLRTLCLARKELDPEEFDSWLTEFQQAQRAMADREKKLMEAAEKIENSLHLLGATAIEDKLQEGVPETIFNLRKAGISIWMLTGDKIETAINVGHACSLLEAGMKDLVLTLDQDVASSSDTAGMVAGTKDMGRKISSGLEFAEHCKENGTEMAIIVDGEALAYCLVMENLHKFESLVKYCKSIICCRVSPLQKALVTKLVKESGVVTLAIGDGANDVGMIQAAHIGVGISGLEGRQAVMNSDFAIAQFRFLERLLLVHGRYNYRRICQMITYFFYKNLVLGLSIFYYNAQAFFSGQLIYNDFTVSLYNVFFTSLTCVVFGVLEKDISPEYALKFPKLYNDGRLNRLFSYRVIGYWLLNGAVQSLIIFFFMVAAETGTLVSSSGKAIGMWGEGMTLMGSILWAVTLQLVLIICDFQWIIHLALWGSLLTWYIFLIIFGVIPPTVTPASYYYLFLDYVATMPSLWLLSLLATITALLPDFLVRTFTVIYRPEDWRVISELAAREKKEVRSGRSPGYSIGSEAGIASYI